MERQHPAMTVGEDGCLGESPNSGDGEKQTIGIRFIDTGNRACCIPGAHLGPSVN